jgi:uncharacterized protein
MTAPRKVRIFAAAAVAGISLALLLPAQAQFWDWGNRPQRQQNSNPFGGWFGGGRGGGFFEGPPQQQQAPVDYSRAPPPAQKKPEATTSIVVVGDANADWLAYGLEDAFAEKPEFNVVRKHRTDSGLISYGRRDVEWPQAVREIIAAEKPKYIVMMIGNNDRQLIREKAPVAAKPGAPKAGAQQAQQPVAPAAAPVPAPAQPDPEQQPDEEKAPELPANATPEQIRQAAQGPWEFHTERWEIAYIKRIDATIAALKSAGVPVIWVGLPSQRGPKASADSAYLNEIYRSRADKAGIIYVDIWDGFVDEGGRFSPQGPDYEGQIRRLRTGDGVYFTKFGARKLAHYVEREIQRNIANRGLPVALPMPVDQGPQVPGGPAQRPAAGPVVPLTSVKVTPEELIGGTRVPPRAPIDATATRVLTKGEPISAPSGRADDFSWPRGGPAANAEPAAAEPAAAPAPAPAAPPAAKKPAVVATPSQQGGGQANQAGRVNQGGQANQQAGQPGDPVQRRARTNTEAPRPPLSIQGLFR